MIIKIKIHIYDEKKSILYVEIDIFEFQISYDLHSRD